MMKKIILTVTLAVCFLCQYPLSSYSQSEESINWEDSVRVYTDSARYGKLVGYEKLAECCHHGHGIKRSIINMMALYDLALSAGGKDVEEYFAELDKDDPEREAFDALTLINTKHQGKRINADSLFHKLRADDNPYIKLIEFANSISGISPNSAKIVMEKGMNSEDSTTRTIYRIAELVFSGRDGEGNYTSDDIKLLESLCADYPLIYNKLGVYYWGKDDFGNAIKNFQKADQKGMLESFNARKLIIYYKAMEKNGRKLYDDEELARLQTLAGSELYEDGVLIN